MLFENMGDFSFVTKLYKGLADAKALEWYRKSGYQPKALALRHFTECGVNNVIQNGSRWVWCEKREIVPLCSTPGFDSK